MSLKNDIVGFMQNLDRFKFRLFEKDSGIFYPDQDSLYAYLSGKYPDSIVMQCTGLKDKNGKLIFEGDIITYKSNCSDTEIAIVRFCDAKAIFGMVLKKYNKAREIDWATCILKDTYTIIGNLYENPELLESI